MPPSPPIAMLVAERRHTCQLIYETFISFQHCNGGWGDLNSKFPPKYKVYHEFCPRLWLFCNKGAYKEIDRTHKRALRILYKDYECPFETLLNRSGSFCIHVTNLQKLMTEIYKSMNHLNPLLVWEFHEKKHVTYDLRI